MFYQDTVVTIVDNNKKPIRELESERLNNGRKCKVILPFDTEYQFLIKNNCDTRIKLDIDIDGTNVTNDGLVVFQYQNFYLERFLNSPEKFKFVRKNNYKVSDPTNIENGTIKVKIYKEKPKYLPSNKPCFASDYMNLLNQGQTFRGFNDAYKNTIIGGCYDSSPTTDWMHAEYDTSSTIKSLYSSSIASSNIGEAGATVGGNRSNQQFTTTEWNGDNGVDTEFIFDLKGLDNNKNEKLEQYYKLKQELGL